MAAQKSSSAITPDQWREFEALLLAKLLLLKARRQARERAMRDAAALIARASQR
jgi:hypothetical protein